MDEKNHGNKWNWILVVVGVPLIAGLGYYIASKPAVQVVQQGAQRAPASSVTAPTFYSYSHAKQNAKNPVTACRAAGGVCVGLEADSCARGPVGDAGTYSCGSANLQCCLPEGQNTVPPADTAYQGGDDAT